MTTPLNESRRGYFVTRRRDGLYVESVALSDDMKPVGAWKREAGPFSSVSDARNAREMIVHSDAEDEDRIDILRIG